MAPKKKKKKKKKDLKWKFEDLDDEQVYIEYRKKREKVDGRMTRCKEVIEAATMAWNNLSATQQTAEADRIRAAVSTGTKLADVEFKEYAEAVDAASSTGKRTDDVAPQENADGTPQAIPGAPGGTENGSASDDQSHDPTVAQSFNGSNSPAAPVIEDVDVIRGTPDDAVSAERNGDEDAQAPLTFVSPKQRWNDIGEGDGAVTSNKPAAGVTKRARTKGGAANPPVSDNRTWVGKRYLGGGGYGTAHAYFALDTNDKIMQRIVVKDSWITSSHWTSNWFWHKNPTNPDGRVPIEVQAMLNMKDKAGSYRIVQHLFHEVYDDRMAYRVIMSYCGHGNLYECISHYAKLRVKPQLFPSEPFVWAVFDAVADICLLLEFGSTDETNTVDSWKQIVHRDFKTENIFLDSLSDGEFSMYPRPVLGDFGLCILTHAANDRENPLWYSDGQGTEFWHAPEQLPMMSATTYEPRRVGKLFSRTNVWAAGAVVARLVDRVKDPTNPKYTKGKESKVEWLEKPARERYSQELQKLILRCVEYKPEDRITARELKKEILRDTPAAVKETSLRIIVAPPLRNIQQRTSCITRATTMP